MPPSGFKVFTAGEVLSANDVNNFIMQQQVCVFDSVAARDSAITSPNEGQFAFLKDTDTLTFYDGTDWTDF